MNQIAADFHLPDEILSVIPTDPYDQMDLARKLALLAIASRVSKLESETGRLRQKMNEKDRTIGELQMKVSRLESMLQESDSRLRVTLDENVRCGFCFVRIILLKGWLFICNTLRFYLLFSIFVGYVD